MPDALRSIADHAREHRLSLIAAGVAFFGLLSIAPGLVALVSIYGLVASPADVTRQIEDLSTAIPADARHLVVDQMEQVVRMTSDKLGVALVIGVIIALWSASGAIKQLLVALNAVDGVAEERPFVRLRGLAALITLGAIAFVSIAVLILTVVPRRIGEASGRGGQTLALVLRWPVLAAMMITALAVVYRYGPDRPRGRWRWWSWGAGAAATAWLLVSAAFSLFTTHFGSYNKTYGTLAGVVVLMLWLYLTALCVLLGAEINAELERGRMPRPSGTRSDREGADDGSTDDLESGRPGQRPRRGSPHPGGADGDLAPRRT